MAEAHIAGLAVRVRPETMDSVVEAAGALDGVEVMATDAVGKVVIVVEADTTKRIADVVDALRHGPGVYAVDMVYHEVDDDASEASEHVA